MKNFVYGSVGLMFGSAVVMQGMIASGVATGLFSTLSLGMILLKIKDAYPKTWAWLMKHHICTDLILSALLAYLVGSGTAVGIVTGASCGLITSALISFFHKMNTNQVLC